jgi:hypothetical protein
MKKQTYDLEERLLKKPNIACPTKTASWTFQYSTILPPVGGMSDADKVRYLSGASKREKRTEIAFECSPLDVCFSFDFKII